MNGSAISSAARPSKRRGADFDPRPFIRARLPLLPVPTIPEISIHTATPATGLWRLAAKDARGFGSPYWAYPWAGGIALARYLLDHPEAVAGRRVLDLGTGSGLVAIAAAKAGAKDVRAVDVDPYAIAALDLNAAANVVDVSGILEDLTPGQAPDAALVLVGDLFYERTTAARVVRFLDRCVSAGTEVLIGDPKRAHLPCNRLEAIADYRVRDFGDGTAATTTASAVYAFGPKPAAAIAAAARVLVAPVPAAETAPAAVPP